MLKHAHKQTLLSTPCGLAIHYCTKQSASLQPQQAATGNVQHATGNWQRSSCGCDEGAVAADLHI